MPRVDAPRLIEMLLAPPGKPALRFILADDAIFRQLAERQLTEAWGGTRPTLYVGTDAVEQFIDASATANLFAPSVPAIVELSPKPTAKEIERFYRSLRRLPTPVESPAYFFGSTAARNSYKEPDLTKLGEVFLCYNPSQSEAGRCAQLLCRRYKKLAAQSASVQHELATKAVHYYSSDLLACDSHFHRMDEQACSFEAALLTQTEVNAFHVVDALASGEAATIELRMQQCLAAGEEPGSILQATVFFLRQLMQVHARLETGVGIETALKEAGIPYPSYDRIRRSLKTISYPKLIQFFLAAPEIELALRQQRQPHDWLATEFIGLVQGDTPEKSRKTPY